MPDRENDVGGRFAAHFAEELRHAFRSVPLIQWPECRIEYSYDVARDRWFIEVRLWSPQGCGGLITPIPPDLRGMLGVERIMSIARSVVEQFVGDRIAAHRAAQSEALEAYAQRTMNRVLHEVIQQGRLPTATEVRDRASTTVEEVNVAMRAAADMSRSDHARELMRERARRIMEDERRSPRYYRIYGVDGCRVPSDHGLVAIFTGEGGAYGAGRPPVDLFAAHEKSIALLRDHLSAEQREMFDRTRNFWVIGSKGNVYLIRPTNVYNIDRYARVRGREQCVARYCLTIHSDGVPPHLGDHLLAQKIALETNENAALKIANKVSPTDHYVGDTSPPPEPMPRAFTVTGVSETNSASVVEGNNGFFARLFGGSGF